MNEAEARRRADYPFGSDIPTRWNDVDSYGHVNNVLYYAWFDTVIGHLLVDRKIIWPYGGETIGLCVASGCEFYGPVHFPDVVEARVRIARMGTTSLRYEVGLFLAGREAPVAAGFFVHAFVDRDSREPVALSAAQRAALMDLVTVA